MNASPEITLRLQAAKGGRGYTAAYWCEEEKEWVLLAADKSLEYIMDIARVVLTDAEYAPLTKVPST